MTQLWLLLVGGLCLPGKVMAMPSGAHGVWRLVTATGSPQRLLGQAADERERRKILEDLKSSEPRLRGDAAWAAGRLRLAGASKGLRVLLRDKDPLVRRNAAWAVGELGLPENALALYDRIIREKEPSVTAELAVALGKLRYMTARSLLLGMTWKSDPQLVAAGITAVGYLGDVTAVGYLMRFVRSRDPVLRQATAVALGKIGGQGAIRALRRLLADPSPAVQAAALEAVAALGDREASPMVLPLLKAGSVEVRHAAVKALGALGTKGSLSSLSPLLVDEEAEVAAEAARTIAHLGGSVPEGRVLELLGSRHNGVRRAAAESAGLAGIRRAIGQLEVLLEHPHPDLRVTAAEALGRLAAVQSLPVMLARLSAEVPQVRVALLDAIGDLRAISAMAAVLPLIRDPDFQVRAAALRALAQMAALDPRPFFNLGSELLGLLRPHQPAPLLRAAADLFGRVPPPRPRAGFVALVRLTLHGDEGVREAVVRSLGRHGDPLARQALERLRRDPAPVVRLEAYRALVRLGRAGGPRARRALAPPDCEHQDGLVHARCLLYRALVHAGSRPVAMEAFREVIGRGPNTPERAALVEVLGDMEAPFAVSLLNEASRAPAYLFRFMAHRALSVWPPPVRAKGSLPEGRAADPAEQKVGRVRGSGSEEELQVFDPDTGSPGCGCAPVGSVDLTLSWILLFLVARFSGGGAGPEGADVTEPRDDVRHVLQDEVHVLFRVVAGQGEPDGAVGEGVGYPHGPENVGRLQGP